MSHAKDIVNCVACRAAAELGITAEVEVDLLHAVAQHTVAYYNIQRTGESVGFDPFSARIQAVLMPMMARSIELYEAPTTNPH